MQETEFYGDDDPKNNFTTEDIKVFDERRKKRLRGESKTYSWQGAKEVITKKNDNKH